MGKLRYIVGVWLVEMAISTNQTPTIYRNLYENTVPNVLKQKRLVLQILNNYMIGPSCIRIHIPTLIFPGQHHNQWEGGDNSQLVRHVT